MSARANMTGRGRKKKIRERNQEKTGFRNKNLEQF
jgi:hypothetical protein